MSAVKVSLNLHLFKECADAHLWIFFAEFESSGIVVTDTSITFM